MIRAYFDCNQTRYIVDDCIALILGGGAGSRLFPLTQLRSKPAVPLAGKYRLIDVPVSNCINSGVDKIFVLTQFNSASLNNHVATYRFDRYRRGFVTVMAAEQTRKSADWFQGTADAVRQSIPHFSVYRHRHVLILSGDQLYSMDYGKLVAHHKAQQADVTVATIPVTADEAPQFGILKTDRSHRITEFHEKPQDLAGKESPVPKVIKRASRVYLASMGIYVFDSRLLRHMLDQRPDDHDFGKQIIPRAIGTLDVTSYPYTGYWSDIGTIRSFFDANLMLAGTDPAFDLRNAAMPLYTNARMLAPAYLEGTRVTTSLVSEGSVIGQSTIKDSIVGIRSLVGHGCTIQRTIIMGADDYPLHPHEERYRIDGPTEGGIGDNVVIENAIVDKNVRIERGCVICNASGVQHADREGYHIRDGIVVIPKNVAIAAGTII